MDYLLDDDSMFCILPEEFKNYHTELLENDGENEDVSDEDIKKAEKILERAKKQDKQLNLESYAMK